MVKDVVFSYPSGVKAINGVSLQVEQGEVIALVGQNGAGKSTLSKLLNGLEQPESGEVLVDGRNTCDSRPDEIASHVGYIFQNPDDQIFSRTIWHECVYALRRRGIDDAEIKERAQHAIDLCGFTGREELNPLDLPLAERKFVTTAAALALRPDYLILDEPTAGLDGTGRRILRDILAWASGHGMAVIAVSHDMRFVIESLPRVVVMARGRVIFDGSAEEAFAQDAVLEEADLRVPPGVELARAAAAPKECIRMDEIVAYLAARR